MSALPKHVWFNTDGQDAANSSPLDWFDQLYAPTSFRPVNQVGAPWDTSGWSPRSLGVDAGWRPPPGSGAPLQWPALADSASPSAGTTSPPPGGASATASASAAAPSRSASSGTTSNIISASGSGLVFHNTFDASCSVAFKACVFAAENELSTLFTNSDTVNVSFHEKNQGNTGFALRNSWPSWTVVSYATLKSKLPSGDVLPSSNPAPAGSQNWYLPEAYARMLGLNSSTPATDDSVTLNTYASWTFGQDVINGLIHELSEGIMGRVGGLGGSTKNGVWSTMDLFRYNASGAPDYSNGRDGQTAYFSSNGGKSLSSLSFHNQYNTSGTLFKGDTADWSGTHVFGGTGAGETLTLVQTELNVMAALGWKVSLSGVSAYETERLN